MYEEAGVHFNNGLIRPRGRLVYINLDDDPDIFTRTVETSARSIFDDVGFRLSPSILPPLIAPASIDNLRRKAAELSERYGNRIDLNFHISYLPVTGCESGWLPWDLFTDIKVSGAKHSILGPMLVSLNHRIMGDPELDEDTKLEFLFSTLGQMIRDWKIVMFVTPHLKPGSFTEATFYKHFDYRNRSFQTGSTLSSIHYFRDINISSHDFLQLYRDDLLANISLGISAAWRDNFKREITTWNGGPFNDNPDTVTEILRRMKS